MAQADESESDAARVSRITQTLAAVRTALPASEDVEMGETTFKVDNSWLHRELSKFEKSSATERATLTLMTERLQAIADRLNEIQVLPAALLPLRQVELRLSMVMRTSAARPGVTVTGRASPLTKSR